MKLVLTFLALFILSSSVTSFAQNAKVEGHIIDESGRSVTGVRVKALFGSEATVSDNKGHFVIFFPASVRPGRATRIEVEKMGWVIYEPFGGNCTVQDSTSHFEPLRIKIVPKRSRLLLSDQSLNNLVDRLPVEYRKEHNRRIALEREVKEERKSQEDLTEKLNKSQDKVIGLTKDLESFAPIKNFAEETGFSPEEVVGALLRWARITKATDKKLVLIRKAYVLKNNAVIIQLTTEAIPDATKILEQKNQESLKAMRDLFHLLMYQGNAYYDTDKYEQALDSYHAIEVAFEKKQLSQELLIEEWADLGLMVGDAAHQLGIRVEGKEGADRLQQALAAYQRAEKVNTYERSPWDWATTQNGLANVLGDLGDRAEGAAGIEYMKDAERVLRNVLTRITRERFPDVWAATETHLGSVSRDLGERVAGVESITYLKGGEAAFRLALTVFNRTEFPQLWAAVQTNLGNILNSLGELVEGPESIQCLEEARKAFEGALEVHNREKSPQKWAAIENNLGLVLDSLGDRLEGIRGITYLKDAEKAYRKALEIRTRKGLPQKWAATQMNLGNLLRELGSRTEESEGIKTLKEGEVALRGAMEVFNREQFPQDWAATASNLGSLLTILGILEGSAGLHHLKDAEGALKSALEVRTQDHLAQKWATTQNSLGLLYSVLGERTEGLESVGYWKEAEQALRATLKVRTRADLPQRWAATENNLGLVLTNLGARTQGSERSKYLSEAEEILLATLEVRTREQLPQKWAMTQSNLSETYRLQQNWVAASEAYSKVLQLFPNRVDAYRGASSLYHEVLFRFDLAFVLHQQWLANNGDDVDALANFAEAHFTTSRFAECRQRINLLLGRPGISVSTKTALRAIEIASLLADNAASEVPGRLDVLIAEVSAQPEGFGVEWSFDGTKHFISQNDKLSLYRVWLNHLFEALAGENRDKIFKALQEVKAKFKVQSRS